MFVNGRVFRAYRNPTELQSSGFLEYCQSITDNCGEPPKTLLPHYAQVNHPGVDTGEIGAFEVDPKGSHTQSMVGTTDLGTLVNRVVLEDLQVSARNDVVDILSSVPILLFHVQ